MVGKAIQIITKETAFGGGARVAVVGRRARGAFICAARPPDPGGKITQIITKEERLGGRLVV